jgi:hypothetical protein
LIKVIPLSRSPKKALGRAFHFFGDLEFGGDWEWVKFPGRFTWVRGNIFLGMNCFIEMLAEAVSVRLFAWGALGREF